MEMKNIPFATTDWTTVETVETIETEPPRLYRRLIYLSQAAMPDRIKLS